MAQETSIGFTKVSENVFYPHQTKAAKEAGDPRGWYCEKIDSGCKYCYAERNNLSRWGNGKKFSEYKKAPSFWFDGDKINAWARIRSPRRMFVNSQTDTFGKWMPDEYMLWLLTGAARAKKQFTYIFTKRIERALYITRKWVNDPCRKEALLRDVGRLELPSNIIIVASVSDPESAIKRIPPLMEIPGRLGISYEPMLEAVDWPAMPWGPGPTRLDWITCGGETGPEARPVDPRAVWDTIQYFKGHDVPVFFKQWGAHHPVRWRHHKYRQMIEPLGVNHRFPHQWLNHHIGHIEMEKAPISYSGNTIMSERFERCPFWEPLGYDAIG